MRREDLFEAIGKVKESQLAVCEKHRNPSVVTHREDSKVNNGGKYCKQTKSKRMPRIWLIAAIIAAMVFLMGCAWVIIEIAGSPLFDYPLTESSDVASERIHLTVSDVTVTSMNVNCTIDGVETNQEAIYILRNGPYTIEKQTDNGWEELAVKIQDPQWDADVIITDGSTDWRVDWTALYGILEPGVYRFTTTVLEGNVPVSTTFTVEEAAAQSAFGDELAKLAREILDRDYFYVRYYEKYEFGSFDKLTDDQRSFLESEYDTFLVHEYLKCGNDMLALTYEGDHIWMGQMQDLLFSQLDWSIWKAEELDKAVADVGNGSLSTTVFYGNGADMLEQRVDYLLNVLDGKVSLQSRNPSGDLSPEMVISKFLKAYYSGDRDAVKQYLSASYNFDVDVYTDYEPADPEISTIKGLDNLVHDMADWGTIRPSIQFRITPDSDYYVYLSMTLTWEDDQWKVSEYGLEG